jgi:hypothetical protein
VCIYDDVPILIYATSHPLFQITPGIGTAPAGVGLPEHPCEHCSAPAVALSPNSSVLRPPLAAVELSFPNLGTSFESLLSDFGGEGFLPVARDFPLLGVEWWQ